MNGSKEKHLSGSGLAALLLLCTITIILILAALGILGTISEGGATWAWLFGSLFGLLSIYTILNCIFGKKCVLIDIY